MAAARRRGQLRARPLRRQAAPSPARFRPVPTRDRWSAHARVTAESGCASSPGRCATHRAEKVTSRRHRPPQLRMDTFGLSVFFVVISVLASTIFIVVTIIDIVAVNSARSIAPGAASAVTRRTQTATVVTDLRFQVQLVVWIVARLIWLGVAPVIEVVHDGGKKPYHQLAVGVLCVLPGHRDHARSKFPQPIQAARLGAKKCSPTFAHRLTKYRPRHPRRRRAPIGDGALPRPFCALVSMARLTASEQVHAASSMSRDFVTVGLPREPY